GAPGVTNATPEGRGKNHKVPAPTVAPNVPGEQGTALQGGGQGGGNRRNSNKHAQGGDQNLPPGAPGVTNATPGGRGRNHKAPSPSIVPNVSQGTPPQSGGQNNAPHKSSKHAQGSHLSTGQVNNQPPASPPSVSTQNHQKHVSSSQDSPPRSNNAPRPSNGQKHQQKQAPQSPPSQ